MKFSTRPKPYRSLERFKQTNPKLRVDAGHYAIATGFIFALWGTFSTVFSIGYVSFFGFWAVRYFTFVDLQWLAFSYLVYILPFIILTLVASFQFLMPIPRPNPFSPGDVIWRSPNWKLILLVSWLLFLILVFLAALVTSFNLLRPPEKTILVYLHSGPYIETFLAGFFSLFSVYAFLPSKVWKMVIIGYITFSMIVIVLYILGNTVAGYKSNQTIASEQAHFKNQGNVVSVMAVGSTFVLVRQSNGIISLRRTDDLEVISE